LRLIDADALLKHEIEADRMGAALVVGKGYIFSAPTITTGVKSCVGCVYDDPEEDWPEICYDCSRCSAHSDLYKKANT
jgi:hypothetical protein